MIIRRSFILKVLSLLLPLVLVFSVVYLRSSITALEYQLGQLQLEKLRLINKKSELIARRAKATSLKKIELVATRKMGLRYIDRQKVFYVKEVAPPAPYTAGLDNNK
ncbi:MAG TPA: hypothetical protein ENK09_03025 [Nitrospirae bacterium]|nr:hypothetical protein [Nitrospirota bacterium]